jgi:hypothetical protein
MGDINKVFIDKIVKLLSKDIYYKDGGIHFELYDQADGRLVRFDKTMGINLQLRDNGSLHDFFIDYTKSQLGLDDNESNIVWKEITKGLKKENFIDNLGWVLFEDYIKYEDDPYRISDYEERVYNIRNFQQFKNFVISVSGGKHHDPHSETSYNFVDMMEDEDFMLVYNYIMNRIEEDL